MKKNNFAPQKYYKSLKKAECLYQLMMKKEKMRDLIISTSSTNAKNINFMAKYGRGLICLALDSFKQLNLSLMSTNNQSRTNFFAISIEAKRDYNWYFSKRQSRTIKIAKKNVKNEIVHLVAFPIIAKDGGVLVRAGHTRLQRISKLAKNNSTVIVK